MKTSFYTTMERFRTLLQQKISEQVPDKYGSCEPTEVSKENLHTSNQETKVKTQMRPRGVESEVQIQESETEEIFTQIEDHLEKFLSVGEDDTVKLYTLKFLPKKNHSFTHYTPYSSENCTSVLRVELSTPELIPHGFLEALCEPIIRVNHPKFSNLPFDHTAVWFDLDTGEVSRLVGSEIVDNTTFDEHPVRRSENRPLHTISFTAEKFFDYYRQEVYPYPYTVTPSYISTSVKGSEIVYYIDIPISGNEIGKTIEQS